MRLNRLKKKISPILKKHQVAHAAIFGSFARGEQKKNSDIDLLIKFRGEKSLLDLVALKFELQKILKRKIDLVTQKALHPYLKKTILKEKIKIL